jgi:FHA domain
LYLQVVETPSMLDEQYIYNLSRSQQFEIDAHGLCGPQSRKDGCAIFGTVARENGTGAMPDVVMAQTINSYDDGEMNKKHFIIRYKADTRGYYLKDTGEGTGTFVRVDRPYVRQS